mgnify:CR=1 FL=1
MAETLCNKEKIYIDTNIRECVVYYRNQKHYIEYDQRDPVVDIVNIISDTVGGFINKSIYLNTEGMGLITADAFYKKGIETFPLKQARHIY